MQFAIKLTKLPTYTKLRLLWIAPSGKGIPRFTGTCYRAANWLHVGQTQGRGKLGPSGKQSVPIKDVWLYPLEKGFKNGLIR